MELLIREATPDDAAGIVAVSNPIIEARSFTLFDTPFSIEAERSYIEGLTSRDIFHVAVRAGDDTVVGFRSTSPFASYTHAFDHVGVIGTYVELGSRRQGIAKSLFLPRSRQHIVSTTKRFLRTSWLITRQPSLHITSMAFGSLARRTGMRSCMAGMWT
jgi:hypothetical protein